ncbi:MAG TPA: DUF4233 domain-containing protein [Pseudonocardiaceae bacterium]|nr:DUF4233 domain-containing protein [Pseudonocardiaceae bacterium]
MSDEAPQGAPQQSVPAPEVDPMRGFRGVMAATLILEAIVVALSLLVVAKLYGGLNTAVGVVVGAVVVVLVVACALLRRPWAVYVIGAAQVALLCCFAGSTPVGVVGVLFTLIWGYLMWLRWDVARRMAAGRLPSQQPAGHS